MAALVQHCLHHPERPAVARCRSCEGSFCRECVVEHDYRIICAACLARLREVGSAEPRRWWISPAPVLQFALGLVILWGLFYAVAMLLLRIPEAVHEGVIWTD